jgi:hypothetical protein
MTLNHINLVIGFIAGLALGIFLHTSGQKPDRERQAMEWRKPLAKAG